MNDQTSAATAYRPGAEDLVIETSGLRKEYAGGRVAVDGLDLAVPRGGVHGFLGPNGSGKTTTIRMLLGLAAASAGRMRLFGTEVPEGLAEVIGRVGAVVESPKFSPNLSGTKNLTLLARSVGIDTARVGVALDTVGLRGRGDDRYKSYSLGMKQRLAIAATLLKDPELMILDEPTNGLDPAGIREIRETIRTLGASGVTVLLSSHILAEVQQVCDSVTIIGNGRMLASGRVRDLLAGAHGVGVRHRVGVADEDAAERHLREAGFTVSREPDGFFVEAGPPPDEITRVLGEQGLWLRELAPVRRDLESLFLELTAADSLGGGR